MNDSSPFHAARRATPAPLSFGRWQLLPQTRQILVDGLPAKLGSRAFDILLLLAERRGEVVAKQELLARVWPGVVVEENNLHLHISVLRKLIGRDAIRTVPGRGYLLGAEPSAPAGPAPAPGPHLVPHPGPPPALPIASAIPADLPLLFGRDAELGALRALMLEHRVVTVVGPGGVGKTRLALEAARAWLERRASPVCVVELSLLAAGASVAEALARALGVRLPEHQAATAEIVDLLQRRELLIVLDNCEHRVDEAAALAERIVQRTQGVRVLATSQAPLHTSTEHVFALAPLAWPDEPVDGAQALRYGAVGLFCARIAAAQHDFHLDAGNVDDVVAICRSLEGLPLALELAAARVPLLGLAALRARLRGRDEARMALLRGGSRSALPRHQTLHAAVDWSYRLLDEEQRCMFRSIGVCDGSFDLATTLDVVAGADGDAPRVLGQLEALVDRSLIAVLPGRSPRYRLLDSTRSFARTLLRAQAELPDAERRRARAMLRRFEIGEKERWQLIPRGRIAVAAMDLDNLRGALNWLEGEPGEAELHLALAGASAWIWPRVSLRHEGLRRCRQALTRLGVDTPAPLEARLQLACARLSYQRAQPDDVAAARRAVDLYRALDDRLELFQSLSVLAIMLAVVGEQAAGEAALAEMDRVFDPEWPVWLWGPRNWSTGLCLAQWDRMDECAAVVDRGMRLARAIGEPSALAMAMVAREQCDSARGLLDSAVAHCREGIAMSRADGSRGRLGILLGDLAAHLAELGQAEAAESAAREALSLRALNGTLWLQLDQIAAVALARGRVREAAMAVGRSDRCHVWSQGRRHFHLRRVHRRVEAELAAALAPDELAGLKAHGASLSDEEVARQALGIGGADGRT